jgi:hypothetical protein
LRSGSDADQLLVEKTQWFCGIVVFMQIFGIFEQIILQSMLDVMIFCAASVKSRSNFGTVSQLIFLVEYFSTKENKPGRSAGCGSLAV